MGPAGLPLSVAPGIAGQAEVAGAVVGGRASAGTFASPGNEYIEGRLPGFHV